MRRRKFLVQLAATPLLSRLLPSTKAGAKTKSLDGGTGGDKYATGTASARSVGPQTGKSKPEDVGTSAQLFIDSRFIEHSENVTLKMNRPLLPDESLLGFERPWESAGAWATVTEDAGIYKMWYGGRDPTFDGVGSQCYATSTDGIHWEKPPLGVIEYYGSRNNNIVITGSHAGTVFIDLAAENEQRYKYVGWMVASSAWDESKGADGSLYVCYSADGIHWKRVREPALPFHMDTQNQAFWDIRLKKYVAYLRSWNPMRTVCRVETEDILHPWPYDKTVVSGAKWRKGGPIPLTTELPVVFAYDERDPVVSDHYNLCVVPYPYAEDVYLGFPSAFLHYDACAQCPRRPENPPNLHDPLPKLAVKLGNDGLLDIQLVVSRDGINWDRPDRKPYIGLGFPGSGRASMIYMSPSLIRKGNQLWLYYVSSDTTHGGRDRSHGFGPDPAQGGENYSKRSIRRAIVPLHRFLSASSQWEGGSLTTPLLFFSGSRLELNVDTSAMGVAYVEILDSTGKPLNGFTAEDCDPINGNFLNHVVSWNEKTDLSMLREKPVRLRFVTRSTDLYAFQFARGA